MSGLLRKDNAFWQRLSNREKFPRSLWFPVYQSLGHDTQEDWQQDFKDVSDTVRRSMFALLGYAGFCALALGQSDEQILKTAGFKLPIIGSTVTVEGFMLFGPLLLIVITVYLHIFVGRLRALKAGKDGEILSPPYLFNLNKRTTRILTALIFYWVPPAVLFSFAWQGAPFLDLDIKDFLLFLFAILTTVTLSLLAIRRCPDDRRRPRNWFAWIVILSMILLWFETLIIEGNYSVLLRKLELSRADLSEMKMRGMNLSKARLRYAELNDSDLREANLIEATLTRADLTSADLSGANLAGAGLSGANLTRADLTLASLSGVKGLTCVQVKSAMGKPRALPEYIPESCKPKEKTYTPVEPAIYFPRH